MGIQDPLRASRSPRGGRTPRKSLADDGKDECAMGARSAGPTKHSTGSRSYQSAEGSRRSVLPETKIPMSKYRRMLTTSRSFCEHRTSSRLEIIISPWSTRQRHGRHARLSARIPGLRVERDRRPLSGGRRRLHRLRPSPLPWSAAYAQEPANDSPDRALARGADTSAQICRGGGLRNASEWPSDRSGRAVDRDVATDGGPCLYS